MPKKVRQLSRFLCDWTVDPTQPEIGKVHSQLIVVFVVETLYRRLPWRPVHLLGPAIVPLAIVPRMAGLGQAMLDPVGLTDHVEAQIQVAEFDADAEMPDLERKPGQARLASLVCCA